MTYSASSGRSHRVWHVTDAIPIDCTMSSEDHSLLFQRTFGGRHATERARKLRLFLELFKLSQDNVRSGNRQLVVFAHDFIAHHINIDGVFEYMELSTLFAWFSARHPEVFDGIAVDIGANIGNHALYFSDYFRRVHCFEPNPRTFKVLALNAELASNITCFNVGISDSDRVAHMSTPSGNVGHAPVSESADAASCAIVLRTLDSLMDTQDSVRLIKIDVEGHEYPALRGAEQTIGGHRPVVLFEQLASEFKGGSSPVIELLRSYGYRRFATVTGRTRRFQSRIAPLDALCRLANRVLPGKSFYFGTEWTVRLCESFSSQDYPFIVALPEWIDLSGKAG